MTDRSKDVNLPWWKHGFVWMVIAGPLLVVVAGLVTFYLAVSRPNEIVSEQKSTQSSQKLPASGVEPKNLGDAPALVGRNHAATGVLPGSK